MIERVSEIRTMNHDQLRELAKELGALEHETFLDAIYRFTQLEEYGTASIFAEMEKHRQKLEGK